jgi:hypothetical protein
MNKVLTSNIKKILNKIVKEKMDALDKRVTLRNYHEVSSNLWKE